MKLSSAMLMLAAGINLQAAYSAETKQQLRKLQSDETGVSCYSIRIILYLYYIVSYLSFYTYTHHVAHTKYTSISSYIILQEELDEVAEKWGNWGDWGDYGGWGDKGSKGSTCPFESSTSVDPFPIGSDEEICLIVPEGMSQPGTPSGTTNGIFCAPVDQYALSITNVSQGSQRLLRVNLDLGNFVQQPPSIVVQALTGVAAPSGETAMITGGTAPTNIDFQGFWNPDCSFRVVSTQGGQLIGKFTKIGMFNQFNIEFTQTGQVTSLLSSLADVTDTNPGGTGPTNPGRPEFKNAIGTITLDFAFAFKGVFDDDVVRR